MLCSGCEVDKIDGSREATSICWPRARVFFKRTSANAGLDLDLPGIDPLETDAVVRPLRSAGLGSPAVADRSYADLVGPDKIAEFHIGSVPEEEVADPRQQSSVLACCDRVAIDDGASSSPVAQRALPCGAESVLPWRASVSPTALQALGLERVPRKLRQ